MKAVKFDTKQKRFLDYMRVGRLGSTDGKTIHLVPICPVFDGEKFYMASHAKTRKVKNLRVRPEATLLIDQYSEDWLRHVAVMMAGTVTVLDGGAEFDRAKSLLKAKFLQYNDIFPIETGEGVVLRFDPVSMVAWDYGAGEFNEPH
jgi:nitroimidazol reductase NimA-like FMN-containing flavoprotein (pyridoxamine 5'-phosphate oxidase superfamily)